MSWLSKLFQKKRVCARCGVQLKTASDATTDDVGGPWGEYFKKGVAIPYSDSLGFQCTKCKKLLCAAHTKQLISQFYSVDSCSFCGAPMRLLE